MISLGIIISLILISLAAALMSGVVVWYKLDTKYEQEVRTLHNRLKNSEERRMFLEEEFIKHMRKYH